MHIGKPIRRVTIQPRKVRRQKPLALPEPEPLIPAPAWVPQREPAVVPVRRQS
jgi:hypothetical protein